MDKPMFSVGQVLEVTDNTGKPFNQVQIVRILGVETFEDGVIDYKVLIQNPDEGDLSTTYWRLDEAVKGEKIFVRVLDESEIVVYPGEDLGDRKNTPITDRATVKRLYQVIEELKFIRENTELSENLLFIENLGFIEEDLDNLIEYAEENLL